MQERKLWTPASWLIVLSLFLASCSAAVTPGPKGTGTKAADVSPAGTQVLTPTPKPVAARYGGILTQATEADVSNLDLIQATGGATANPLMPIYDSLLTTDPLEPLKIMANLAKTYDVSTDGLRYTFHLHQDVKFHDGKTATSEDVAFNMKRMANPPQGTTSVRKSWLSAVDKIESPDANTLVITLKRRDPAFLSVMASGWMGVLPKHIIQEKGNMTKDVVGTGPFKLKNHTRGVSLRTVKNPDYFVRGLPYLDGIDTYVIPDQTVRTAALRTGRILLIREIPGVTVTQSKTIREAMGDKVVVEMTDHALGSFLLMNFSRKPFSDPRVRLAVSWAIDRELGMHLAAEGAASTGGILWRGWGNDLDPAELAKMPGYGPDKEANRAKARSLLAAAGYPNGFKTSLSVQRELGYTVIEMEFVKEELKKIGIDAELNLMEKAAFLAARQTGGMDAVRDAPAQELPDATPFLKERVITGSSGTLGYSNPKVDELIERQSTIADPSERKKLLDEISRTVLMDGWVSLWWYKKIAVYWAKVKGWKKPPQHFYSTRHATTWLAE
ncbi:MAG: ABC transporter substrate-binding protein [Chloroflexi bacterium]|nr:ABC transporter substrate-binding protein [Chloroflexota bacterium]